MIDLTLPPLPEEEYRYPLPVRSICLNLFWKTLYRLPPLFAEDGRGLRTATISKWQPQKNTALTSRRSRIFLRRGPLSCEVPSRRDSVGGGVVAEIFCDLRKPARFQWGRGSTIHFPLMGSFYIFLILKRGPTFSFF